MLPEQTILNLMSSQASVNTLTPQYVANNYARTGSVTTETLQYVLNLQAGNSRTTNSAQAALFYNLQGPLGLTGANTTYSVQKLLNMAYSAGLGLSDLFFNPTLQPGLQFYVDARSVAGIGNTLPADGTALASWSDLSGGAHHATQATGSTQPIFHNTGGAKYVQFDGVDDNLSTGAIGFTNPTTWYAVASVDVIPVTASTPWLSATDVNIDQYAQLSSQQYASFASNPLLSGVAIDTNKHVFATIFNGASSTFTVDGAVTTGDTGATASYSGIRIGANFSLTAFLAGKVYAILVYNGTHTTAQRQNIERWLASNYGVTTA